MIHQVLTELNYIVKIKEERLVPNLNEEFVFSQYNFYLFSYHVINTKSLFFLYSFFFVIML
jgi:hypothetical protein